jgi:hypothetical protein
MGRFLLNRGAAGLANRLRGHAETLLQDRLQRLGSQTLGDLDGFLQLGVSAFPQRLS